MMIRRKILGFLLIAHSAAGSIQQFGIGGFAVVCKPGARAREVGDDPIQSPLQFHYITQDNYSCLIQLHPEPIHEHGARVAIVTFEDRYQRDINTKQIIKRTPVDHGISGLYEFMYTTRGKNNQILFGFVDYGKNGKLREFLQSIKMPNNSVSEHEKQELRQKSPLSFRTMKQHADVKQ